LCSVTADVTLIPLAIDGFQHKCLAQFFTIGTSTPQRTPNSITRFSYDVRSAAWPVAVQDDGNFEKGRSQKAKVKSEVQLFGSPVAG
jgi:hypothetical protein